MKAPKFRSKDQGDLYARLLMKKDLYMAGDTSGVKHLLWWKSMVFITIAAIGYTGLLVSTGSFSLLLCYVCFGGGLVLLGVNIGHDAAHGCVTGNKRRDLQLFRIIFGIQGLNGYLWEIRHNHSHHPFPNVPGYDCDLETSGLFYLSPKAEKKWFHRYQHVYAPVVYALFSIISVCYIDLKFFFRKRVGNISFTPSRKDWVELWCFKLIHFAIYIGVPVILSDAGTLQIVLSYVGMHLLLSLLISFVFFVSHHVEETSYSEIENNEVPHSWIENQVRSTLDFHAGSKLAGFFFGGFNAHLAHHLFPTVSHVYYPALSKMIKKELSETSLNYNSLGFMAAVASHLRLLKKLPR